MFRKTTLCTVGEKLFIAAGSELHSIQFVNGKTDFLNVWRDLIQMISFRLIYNLQIRFASLHMESW